MIRIARATKEYVSEISELFVECFYDMFKSFVSDKNKLIKAFKHIFIFDRFYVAFSEDEVIGIGAVSDGSSTIKINKFKLCYYLGINNGKRAYKYLKTILEEKDYAFEMDSLCGLLEYIGVREKYRNKGIGSTLVNHIMYDNSYIRYIAKVGDTSKALNLFKKIGFEEFDREKASEKEKIDLGVNDYLYMIYAKE